MLEQQSHTTLTVIIPSAGSANRMNGMNKQLYTLGSYPVVEHSIRAFATLSQVKEIIVVCRSQEQTLYHGIAEKYNSSALRCAVALGGETRQDSVFSGIRASTVPTTHFAIHDGARPLIDRQDIIRCITLAAQKQAAAVGVPVKDTIKTVNEQGEILSTLPRELTYVIQTPQIFARALYFQAMEQSLTANKTYTDDCQLIEALGIPVYISQGSYRNIKITTPEDIPFIEELQHSKKE